MKNKTLQFKNKKYIKKNLLDCTVRDSVDGT
jgi:hypothetical protein